MLAEKAAAFRKRLALVPAMNVRHIIIIWRGASGSAAHSTGLRRHATIITIWREAGRSVAHRTELRKQRGAKWRDWVKEAAKDKPGALYQWIRGEARSEIRGIHAGTGWTMEPGPIAEAVRAKWRQYWNPTGAAPWQERRAEGPQLPAIDPEVLAELARKLSVRKAVSPLLCVDDSAEDGVW